MKNCNNKFSQHTGTSEYHRVGFMGGLYATDGVIDVAEKTQSYWLLDLISSHQFYESVRNTPHQVWKLVRIEGSKFKATCEDGNDNVVTSQDIPYSDFEYDTYTIWKMDNVLMLPSEN